MTDWKSLIEAAARTAGHVLDGEVVEELAAHARTAFETARAEGSDSKEAERDVRLLVESWIAEAGHLHRRRSAPPLLESEAPARSQLTGIFSDLRYAFRLLVRQRSFSVLAIATMALGIGVMTTLFSVTYGVLLRPLPWNKPEQLIRLTETHPRATRSMRFIMTNTVYLPWRASASSVESLAAWAKQNATVTGTRESERLMVATVSGSLFSLLRAAPMMGEVFTTADELPDPPISKVVLSYGLWQQRFGGNPNILGQNVQLNGKVYSIVAVMPRDFYFPDHDVRAWIPLYIPPFVGQDGRSRTLSLFSAMARLKPGVSISQAEAEATALARTAPDSGDVGIAVFGVNTPAEIKAVPALQALTEDVRPALISLLFAVALLLLTAVGNVASLQLARATARRREMAIRAAIGAGTARIAQQLMMEGLLLGIAGGIAGLALAAVMHALLPAALPSDFPRLADIGMAWTVVGFAAALTIVAGLLLGLVPALNLRRTRMVETLLENGTAVTGVRRTAIPGARSVIMAGQIAIACTLLIGAMLLTRSFLAMLHADRGFDSENVLTARIGMPEFAFGPQRRIELTNILLERARLLPGATHIGFTTGLPLINSETIAGFRMKSLRPPVGETIQVNTARSVVSEDYLSAIGMRIIAGRGFDSHDTASSAKVLVVNKTFARRYLTDKAIGDRIANFANDNGIEFEVIGIVDDVQKHAVTDPLQPEVYSLARQMGEDTYNPNMGSLVIRTAGDPRAAVEPLKRLVQEEDPSMTVESIVTMADRVAGALARPRFYATLLATFAVCAGSIAFVGLFGVLSYSVAQRQREIAIRSAIGATPSQVVGLILRQGLVITACGLALGIGLATAVIQYLSSLLYGVRLYDPASFIAIPLAVAAMTSLASLLPAVRAARIDPMKTIRNV